MFNPNKLKDILKNSILQKIEEINQAVDTIHSGGIKSFLVERLCFFTPYEYTN